MSGAGEQVDLIDEFRAVIRLSAADSSKTVNALLYSVFDFVATGKDDEKVLSFGDFEKGLMQITAVNKKIRRSDMSEIFEDIDVSGQGTVTVEDLADFCQRSVSKARALSLKLRKAVIEIFKDDGGLQRAFSTLAGSSKYAELNHFTEFAEDSLGLSINESDAVSLYGLYDVDGDGKINLQDFLTFMGNPSTPDAAKAVDVGDPEVILDMKVSCSRAQEDDLIRQGYQQILPDFKRVAQAHQRVEGSFGKGNSVWIWRRKQGSCAGKLKPIIDIQLTESQPSSTMVISGYICLSVPVSGQWVWIKRASTLAEEAHCIVDMQVTIGRMSNPVDTIWSGPGPGWSRVDGNFGKSFINSWTADAFLWYLPSQTRAAEANMTSPVRNISYMSEELRQETLLSAIRRYLRHYVPVETMKATADPFGLHNEEDADSFDIRTVKFHDFSCSALFYKYCSSGSRKTLSLSRFKSMLYDIGLRLDKGEIGAHVFHYFDVKQDKSINREEFNQFVSLTPYELDETVLQIKERLWTVTKGSSKLKHNRLLRDIFNILNVNQNKIIDLVEILMMTSRLGIFLTEEEGRDLRRLMDLDKDDRVTEKDFVGFMKSSGNLAARRAQRVRDSAVSLRRWLIRGSSGLGAGNSTKANAWKDLEVQHKQSYGSKFPGYFIPLDFSLIMSKLGIMLSPVELRELTMVVAPTEDGRVHKHDIERFTNSSSRAFGEILSMLEKDILKPIVDVYKEMKYEAEKKSSVDGKNKIEELQNEYDEILGEIVHAVRNHRISGDDVSGGSDLKHEVVSPVQVKAGIETLLSSYYTTPPHLVPNLEEWVCLACMTDSAVTEENHFGINIKHLLEGICLAITGGIDYSTDTESTSVDMLCRDLQRMIIEEAQFAGSRVKNGKKRLDYQAAFALFDDDGTGTISVDEFQHMMVRLQLVDLLPEGQLAKVVAKFDTQGKGYISYDDFEAFAESGLFAGIMQDIDDEEEDEDFGMSSNTPPVAITKNSDMDWLAWFLYKEAYKIDSVDPESVINELEAVCTESEVLDNQGAVTKKELWTILSELKLKGGMSHRQFEAAIDHITCEADEGNPKGEELVDYESLCRYVIRMGRAYNSLIQEQKKAVEAKYSKMKEALLKELTSMVSHGTDQSDKFNSRKHGLFSMEHGKAFGTSNFRYEKVFRRLDDDGDGRISCREFKNGLRRLRVSNEKAWSLKLIRKLFDDCDDNGDGLLDLREFSGMINNWINGNPNETDAATKNMVANLRLDDDDDGDGDGIFKKERVIYDSELFQKITSTLLDVVPAGNSSGQSHIEAVKSAVRKFFSRSDPDNTGVVSEERFRAFCRRSSLQERLSTSEMRALLDKLRKRNRRSRIRSSSTNGFIIDYEKFLHQITKNGESVPHSHAESALTRLQDAAVESAAAGRPFIGLCSLVDPKLTGTISSEELIMTVKMMGITISEEELRAVQELLPPGAVGKDGSFDYRELYWTIQHHTPPPAVGQRNDFHKTFDFGARTLSPTTPFNETGYRTRKGYRETPHELDYGGGTLSTPMGTMVATPMKGGDTINTALYRSSMKHGHTTADRDPRYSTSAGEVVPSGTRTLASSAAYERQIDLLGDRTKLAVEDKSRQWGSPFSLRKQFEVYDSELTGLVSLRTFQSTLDELGVMLSATELHAIQSYFGRPEDNMIDYHTFCATFFEDTVHNATRSKSYTRDHYHNSRGHHGGMTRHSYDRDRDNLPAPSRITETLRKLKRDGKDPRDIFEAYDLDQTGLVDVKDFRRVVNQLQLLQTEHQLHHAEETYASLSDRYLICYEDFCRALEVTAASEFGPHEYGATRRNLEQSGDGARMRSVMGDGYDGRRSRDDHTYGGNRNRGEYNDRGRGLDYDETTPRDGYSDTFHRGRSFDKDFSSTYDKGGSLLPPKPSDSVSRFQTRNSHTYNTSSSYDSGRFRSSSPTPKSRSSMEPPRSPPGKVGSIMWGSDTPLAQKGDTPHLAGTSEKWVCSVCYFTENQKDSQQCEVCESPNYNNNKVRASCVPLYILSSTRFHHCSHVI